MSSEKFQRCLAFVLRPSVEGGFVNHPNDPGGRTYRGISERAHPEAWKPGPPTDAEVEAIYERAYWAPVLGDRFPEPLSLALLDYAVHSGCKRALAGLAALLGMSRDSLPEDLAKRVAGMVEARSVAINLVVERAIFLVRRALVTPGQDVFARGWITRMVELKKAVEAAPEEV